MSLIILTALLEKPDTNWFKIAKHNRNFQICHKKQKFSRNTKIFISAHNIQINNLPIDIYEIKYILVITKM